MYLIFDTETTGLPKNWNAPVTDVDNWPRCVQIAWQLHDREGKLLEDAYKILRSDLTETALMILAIFLLMQQSL